MPAPLKPRKGAKRKQPQPPTTEPSLPAPTPSPSTLPPTNGHQPAPPPSTLSKPNPSPTSPLLTLSDIRHIEAAAVSSLAGLNDALPLLDLLPSPSPSPSSSPPAATDADDVALRVAAYQALHRIFEHHIDAHTLSIHSSSSSSLSPLASQLQGWLHSLYVRYIDASLTFLVHPHPTLHLSALHSLLALTKLQCTAAGTDAASLLSSGLFASTLIAVLLASSPPPSSLLDPFLSQYLLPHADLRLHALRIIKRTLSSSTSSSSPSPPLPTLYPTSLTLLLSLSSPSSPLPISTYILPPPSPTPASLSKALSQAYLALLSIPPPTPPLFKLILSHLPSHILPHVPPPLLADFLSDSFSLGGVSAVLSLSSLFTLITQHRLDYPHVYHRLYQLLTPGVTASRYRGELLRLVGVMLGSAYLSEGYVKAFVKRLARVALVGGVDSAVVLLGVVYNLVKKHKGMGRMVGTHEEVVDERQKQLTSLTDFLLQRQQQLAKAHSTAANASSADDDGLDDNDDDDDADASAPAQRGVQPDVLSALQASTAADEAKEASSVLASGFLADPFDALTSDLEKCGAEQSTLWEVRTLTSHYDPTLSGLASMFFADNAPKTGVDVSEYAGLSYEALKLKEMERRKRQKVPVNFVQRTRLFGEGEIFAVNFQV